MLFCGASICFLTQADINLVGEMKSPAEAGLSNHWACFGAWPVVAGLAASGAAGLGMLSYAVVDEVTPLHEVDGGILLGCLRFA